MTFGRDRGFVFDHVFDQSAKQQDIFRECASGLVDDVFQGYNACVFAYGQTSSGKTFTMGSGSHLVAEEDVGLIPRVINAIFDRIEAEDGNKEEEEQQQQQNRETRSVTFKIRCQFLEIHNEEVKDLLAPTSAVASTSSSSPAKCSPAKSCGMLGNNGASAGNGIAIRENSAGEIVVSGATEEVVEKRGDLMRLLEMGSASRTTGDTRMNAHSSRSHAIFTILLDQDIRSGTSAFTKSGSGTDEGSSLVADRSRISAKFHLVDLAGSERQKKTGATGKRFKESVTINKGLLALGNVISALSSSGGSSSHSGSGGHRHVHVPYRESKLTRMLQDSIGGNSRTIMIACASTSDTNMEESLNTLKYASRARNIKNVAYVNYRKDPKEKELPDSNTSNFSDGSSHEVAENASSRIDLNGTIMSLSTKLKEVESKNSTLQRLLDDKVAVESSLQQLVHQFTSTGLMSMEAANVFKEAFMAPSLNAIPMSPGSTQLPPRPRPASATHRSKAQPAPSTSEQKDHKHSHVQLLSYPFVGESAGVSAAEFGTSDFSVENGDEVLFDQDDIAGEGNGGLDHGSPAAKVFDSDEDGGVDVIEEEGLIENNPRSHLGLSKLKLEEELKQLSSNIIQKEELIVQLTKNQKEAEVASQEYENRAQQLEKQVIEKEQEVSSLKREVCNLDESIAQSVEEKHELRLEYDEKLMEVTNQLDALREKLAEGNAARLERVRLQSEEKISHLESDLNSMKVKQTSLKKKLRDTQDAYEQEVERKNQELEKVRKEADNSNRRIQQLEMQNKRQTTLLKRKSQEAASAQRKLKELNQNQIAADGEREKVSPSKRSTSNDSHLVGIGKQIHAHAAGFGSGPRQSSNKTKAALDKKVEKLVQKNEIKEQLECQKRRKIELMAERESILQELSPYQKKRAKQEEITHLKIREFMYAIEELDAEIDKMQGEASAGNEIAAKEVTELQNFRSDAYARRCDLQNMLSSGKVLDEKDEQDCSELEDRLDGIVTELDYVVQQINESKTQLEEAETSGRSMKKLMSNLSQKEIQSLLGMYLNNMVDLYSKEKKANERLCELEVMLAEKSSQINHLTSSMQARDFEYDLRTTQLEKEHANKIQDVFSHINLLSSMSAKSGKDLQEKAARQPAHREEPPKVASTSAEATQDGSEDVDIGSKEMYGLVKLQQEHMEVLDKQNVQLKDTNEGLAQKVRQLQEQMESSQSKYEQNILSMSLKFEESNNLNQNLMEEVSNYKKHLRSLGNAVRISRSSLRPLSAKQMREKQLRMSIS